MEHLVNCGIVVDIECIENISGCNPEFEILFLTKGKEREDYKRYKLIFKGVRDMRCSTEDTSVDRFTQYAEHWPEGLIQTSIYLVENSEYIKYVKEQAPWVPATDKLKHYFLGDNTDSILDILTTKDPEFLEVE